MNKEKIQKNKGFTLIEALIAIFILTVSVSSMLGVTASSANSARYANNEITANYLLQEAVDYIKNNRDTIAFQKREVPGFGWGPFLNKYGAPSSRCFNPNTGCDIKMEYFNPDTLNPNDIVATCTTDLDCGALYYNNGEDPAFFYSHDSNSGFESNFKRSIVMEKVNDDQIKITVTVKWKNGNLPKSQILVAYLLNWQK